MREDIAFSSDGLTLRGWLYRAPATPSPAIVMSHGFSAVKGQGLAGFAERFQAAGFTVVVFDYRHLGDSDGDDRGRIIAQEQHDDLRAAITFTASLPGVDSTRIGVWGTSYSGGHAMFVGLLDPRVKAIVAQAPAISVARSLIGIAGQDGFSAYLEMLAADHASRNSGNPGGRIAVVAPSGEPSVLATPDSWDWFTRAGGQRNGWVNHTSLESVARMAEYMPASLVGVVASKPLLLIAAQDDSLIPIDHVRAVHAAAGEPRQLNEYPCGHFDFYPGGPFHEEAATGAADWFRRHLAS